MNSKPMLRFQVALLAGALALLAISVPRGLGNPFAVLGLAAVAALAERGRVQLTTVTQVSISVLPTVFAAAGLDPRSAACGGGLFPKRLPG